MRQQINLYQPIFRRERKVFSSGTMGQIVLAIALGLALLYGFGWWQVSQLEGEVVAIEAQRAEAEQRMRALSADLATRRNNDELQAAIERASEELASRRRLLEWLGERGGTAGEGFATHLAALARQHRPGLWLDEVQLEEGGSALRLAGGTQDPAELVRYLRRLGSEPAFANAEFRTVRIERDAGGGGAARFVVASGLEEASP